MHSASLPAAGAARSDRVAAVPRPPGRGKGLSPAARPEKPNPLVCLALYLFAFSIPFEMPNRTIPVEVTTLTAQLLITAALIQPRLCFRRPPAAAWWFLAFVPFYVFSALLDTDHQREAVRITFGFLQGVALMWILGNLMRHERVGRSALLALVAGCSILALMQILGIGRTSTEAGSGIERLTVFGQNPNSLGRIAAVGALAALGISYNLDRSVLRPRMLAWPILALIVLAILKTGSRISLLCLGAGLLCFAFRGGSVRSRLRNAAVVLLAASACVWLALRSERIVARFERTVTEGSFAKREDIFPEAWQMFLERPLFGWGAVRNRWELGTRLADPEHPSRDTHNLLLELLTATGFLGALPFLVGVCLCLIGAWRARSGTYGVLPLAMLAAVIVANVSGNLIGQKLQWLVFGFALACAAGTGVAVPRWRPARGTPPATWSRRSSTREPYHAWVR